MREYEPSPFSPAITFIGLVIATVASCITIFIFITGKESVPQLLTPTPVSGTAQVSLVTATANNRKTATPFIVDPQYRTIPLSPIANDDLGAYGRAPVGNVELGGVPFYIAGAFGTQGDLFRERPETGELEIKPGIKEVEKVFVLINSGNTYEQFRNLQTGVIELEFDDRSVYRTQLVVGQNIREWMTGGRGVVNTTSSPAVQEVWQVQKEGEKFAAIDMLTIKVPENQRMNKLVKIRFRDTSLTTTGSYDPGFSVYGVTIERNEETTQ